MKDHTNLVDDPIAHKHLVHKIICNSVKGPHNMDMDMG